MRYIRFLKTPRIIQEKNNPSKTSIYALVTITSDLGDSFLSGDLTLSAELHSANSKHPGILVWRTVQWSSGMRTLAISLPLSQRRQVWPVRVRVGVDAKSKSDEFEKLYSSDCCGVVSAWSAELNPAKGVREAQKLVERRLAVCGAGDLHVWEETGESIARHVWDAGVTMACHIGDFLAKLAQKKDSRDRSVAIGGTKKLRVIELGTGCGIVGISIAQFTENADVILTDLPEAEEIVERNISCARLAEGTKASFLQLDWDDDLPTDLLPNINSEGTIDLIVASDCTYNADSSPALVNILQRLAKVSSGAPVMIAMKKRHDSEEVFFQLMADAGFQEEDVVQMPLPGDEHSENETVFVHTFRHRQR
ncbi:hypothetical protein M011DRAFT_439592 [Sporormia fimetaria CBS 119925]|uniref:Uncharacterized protein n=1 Tax=Sporormia fimetaria CBS 119925 TaxID=1340428 RepID=A0A6A6VF63_9PLEO|nr:hypothetical protein M011DRAFT_439592 [Sporormia fimetaria CBS 119925]